MREIERDGERRMEPVHRMNLERVVLKALRATSVASEQEIANIETYSSEQRVKAPD